MPFNYAKSFISVPRNNTDKIIGYFPGTLNVGASGSFTIAQATTTVDSTLGQSALPIGIYSVNGGSTWNDMGVSVPNGTALQTEECTASVSPTGIITVLGTNWYNTGTTGFGSGRGAITILFKILLLAKKDQGLITPPIITGDKQYHSSRYNYQKIFLDDVTSVTAAGSSTGQTPITHGLGYNPLVRTWINSSGTIRMNASYVLSGGTSFAATQVKTTTSDVIFYADNRNNPSGYSVNLIYRVYLDG